MKILYRCVPLQWTNIQISISADHYIHSQCYEACTLQYPLGLCIWHQQSQYTSFYRTKHHLSTFLIHTHLNDTRYKKKPILSENTYLTVKGFITHVDINVNTGQLLLFHMYLDNISFLGKAVLPVLQSTPGKFLTQSSQGILTDFDSFTFNPVFFKTLV